MDQWSNRYAEWRIDTSISTCFPPDPPRGGRVALQSSVQVFPV